MCCKLQAEYYSLVIKWDHPRKQYVPIYDWNGEAYCQIHGSSLIDCYRVINLMLSNLTSFKSVFPESWLSLGSYGFLFMAAGQCRHIPPIRGGKKWCPVSGEGSHFSVCNRSFATPPGSAEAKQFNCFSCSLGWNWSWHSLKQASGVGMNKTPFIMEL